MSDVFSLLKLLLTSIPLLVLIWLNKKNNLKKEFRSKQVLMPAVALVYVIVIIILLGNLLGWVQTLTEKFSQWLTNFGESGSGIGNILGSIGNFISGNILYITVIMLNVYAIILYMGIKRTVIAISKKAFKPGSMLFDNISSRFYEVTKATKNGGYYVLQSTVQARIYLKVFYVAASIISILIFWISTFIYGNGYLETPFMPVLGIIVIGELYFYIDGITEDEDKNVIKGERDSAINIHNYFSLRKVLGGLFGDKLLDDNSANNPGLVNPVSSEEIISQYMSSPDMVTETYGKYMDKFRHDGNVIDANYLASGLDLLMGKSIHFNNPFYNDLVPYIFYAMNHKLLQHKKVLIVLGRHGIEEDLKAWCMQGLRAITNVEGMWRIGTLNDKKQELDVGILTRSGVQNLNYHRANSEFFKQTEYIVIVEPSKLITTAQVGLNSVVRSCRTASDKNLVFCSMDKNCDGLVDALSHALMTSISEVSATEAPTGVSSYMCWTSDNDKWQHRIISNIARYLGIGTELSFVAFKNRVAKTNWYGGEGFPVKDMNWIAKQYYGKLLTYAELPVSQEMMDEVFHATDNMWSAKKTKKAYITVEDESNNLFEIKREFATRTSEESFVNVISSPYLLCDYMADNGDIFSTDSKAIPYIVADYAMTNRNVLTRIATLMAAGEMWESAMRKELLIIGNIDGLVSECFWNAFCSCYNPIGKNVSDDEPAVLTVTGDGVTYEFDQRVIVKKKKYNIETGEDEYCYRIKDEAFVKVVLGDMLNVKYIAEDGDADSYIGTEIKGQIFQKYLPGQFLTLCGLYYEMVDMTYDGKVRLRRAADHISGRPAYRQVRNYVIKNLADDPTMGSEKKTGKFCIAREYADMVVSTCAYWNMPAYNDFVNADRVEINGIPDRYYNNKWILRIEFNDSEKFTDEVRFTLTAMFNEVFRTLFAENQDLIIAVTGGDVNIPLTYSINSDCEGFNEKAIYIIEDCQYDVGLLTAVERNIGRILQIVCDYLQWNDEKIQESLENPVEEEIVVTPETVTEEETSEEIVEEAEETEESSEETAEEAEETEESSEETAEEVKEAENEAEESTEETEESEETDAEESEQGEVENE